MAPSVFAQQSGHCQLPCTLLALCKYSLALTHKCLKFPINLGVCLRCDQKLCTHLINHTLWASHLEVCFRCLCKMNVLLLEMCFVGLELLITTHGLVTVPTTSTYHGLSGVCHLCTNSVITLKICAYLKSTKSIQSKWKGVRSENQCCICINFSGSGCGNVQNIYFLLALLVHIMKWLFYYWIYSISALELFVSNSLPKRSVSFQFLANYQLNMDVPWKAASTWILSGL